ncbi:MAG TPA: histidine kinase [Terriglobales bacterium]|jgi:signal transduction histidine kinase|nr:histidine kinase [Terriglobales bacterium]
MRSSLLAIILTLFLTTLSSSQTRSFATLTRASQVRELSPDQAALGYPVRIRGVITGDVPSPDFFIQDESAGIYVEGSPSPRFPHVLGKLVELEGITGPGKFAPVIKETKLSVLGEGTLPQARVHSFSDLADGQLDSQWVAVRGIVRAVSIDRTSWRELTLAMHVASGGGEFNVRIPIPHEQDFSSWIDSEVLLEGVCGSLFNQSRQLIGVLFYVPRLSFLKIETPAREEVPFSALLRFTPGKGGRHRVRVQGTVAYQQRGSALFIESKGKGLRVLTEQDTPLEVGDIVDVLGFPSTGESAPILVDAVFHRVGRGIAPSPIPLQIEKPWEQFDGALVETDARLIHSEDQASGRRMMLQKGNLLFEALLPLGGDASAAVDIPINSEVRLRGVSLVRGGGLWSVPQSIRLLVRRPADLVVLSAPSWWTVRHTLWLLGITFGSLLALIGLVVVLRRRLGDQMEVIRQKSRTGAVLEERNRIARELHDTLEQELAGITMQLDLAADCFQQAPRVAKQAVETARNMSRHSMLEARRSVWDLRCHLLENGDLVSALSQIVEPLATRDQTKISMSVSGVPSRLSGHVEMNLLRIGQEAVANAVKHGKAGNVKIDLVYEADKVILSIRDDGQGFTPVDGAASGHFGLLDMRERAQSMGTHLKIESARGQGTELVVEVPMTDKFVSNDELKADLYTGR